MAPIRQVEVVVRIMSVSWVVKSPCSPQTESMGGLKTLGKAGKAVTKQLGKTLHSLGDSPDRRGQDLLLQAQNPRSADKIRREREMNVRQRRKVNFGLENSGT